MKGLTFRLWCDSLQAGSLEQLGGTAASPCPILIADLLQSPAHKVHLHHQDACANYTILINTALFLNASHKQLATGR